ncbi:MAG: RsmD family RNA methyltransferase [Phycisphaeraceae bacterium]
MRIIAGKHRGRRLAPPEGNDTTRPITDLLKETLFNRLKSLGALEPEGFVCFDLFCGTGSLGIEAISRGAGRVTFVDRDRYAIEQLERNLETLGETDRADVRRQSASSTAWLALHEPGVVSLAFVDPPFAMMQQQNDRRELTDLLAAVRPTLEPGGVLVLRGPRDADPLPAEHYDGPASFTYGKSTLHFYQSPLEDE